jgi:uncharacterized protein with von Willebrand factor type A (vWA) domain
MSAEEPLLLYGVFRELVHNRVPLGVTDYLDAVRALEWQIHRDDPSRFGRRDGLRRLCHVLWARSPDEIRLIDRIFENIPVPTWDELEEIAPTLDATAPSTDRRASGGGAARSAQGAVPGRRSSDVTDVETGELPVSFEAVSDAGGVLLPYPVLPAASSETFVMQPQTVMSARALAVLWRRYRRMVRTGARTELDVEATTGEWIRRGLIDRPILRPRRANTAKLLILADASPSMSAWDPFLETLGTSIALSRLQSARLLFFVNVPRQSLFESPALTGGVSAKKAYERHAGAGLLVISDAGAARGFLNRPRATQTRKFLDEANRLMRAVVWINPMPSSRWQGTTAEAIATESRTAFLPLDYSSMIRAVDILRGAKSR